MKKPLGDTSNTNTKKSKTNNLSRLHLLFVALLAAKNQAGKPNYLAGSKTGKSLSLSLYICSSNIIFNSTKYYYF